MKLQEIESRMQLKVVGGLKHASSISFILLFLLWLNPMEHIEAQPNVSLSQMYEKMYQYMIEKDTLSLGKLLDDEFVLVHMTGMRQPKSAYLRAIADGTLNYYACDDTRLTISVNQSQATLQGKSLVRAAVFGGGQHTWRLQQLIQLKRKDDHWLMTEAVASTY